MSEVSFSEAIAAHAHVHFHNDGSASDVADRFLEKLEAGTLQAHGHNFKRGEYEDIPVSFWAWFRKRFQCRKAEFNWAGGASDDGVWHYVGGERQYFYDHISVLDGVVTQPKPQKSKGGRPPSQAWPVTAAIAVRLVAENDYPATQKEFRELLADEMDRLGLENRLEESSIEKLVRAIFMHKPRHR